jgi:hypothetical protein
MPPCAYGSRALSQWPMCPETVGPCALSLSKGTRHGRDNPISNWPDSLMVASMPIEER